MLKNITNALVAGLFLLFTTTGCGSGGGHILTQKEAQAIITNYSSSSAKAPTLNDYKIAGITGITIDNLAKVNAKIHSMMNKADIDELPEIQALVNSVISENPPLADSVPPVITLLGNAAIALTVGDTYVEAGATAVDDKDGVITANIIKTGSVNTATVGTYSIAYNVKDAANNAAVEVVRTVTVNATPTPNQAPTANAGADMSVEVNKAITVTGSGMDPEGKTLTYKWAEGTTQLATTASFSYVPHSIGDHTITLTVTDNKGLAGTDTVKIAATATPPPNQAPTANAGADMSVEVNKSIKITGIGTDPEGKTLTYKWTKGTTVLGTSAVLTYTPTTLGDQVLTLTVTDNKGLTAIDTVKITAISAANQAPAANAGADMSVEVNKAITVTGSGTDPEGKTLTYKWTEEATQLATTATFSYTPSTAGVHTLILTVLDEKGLSGTDTVKVTATSPVDNKAPAITLKGPATIDLNVGDTYTEPGATASDNVDTAVTVVISGAVDTAKAGTYIVKYTATDKAGNTSSKERTVTVTALATTQKELWFTFKGVTATVDAGTSKVNSLITNAANISSLVYTDGTAASGIVFDTTDNFEGLNGNGYSGTSGNIVPVSMLTKNSWFVGEYDLNGDGTKDMSGAVVIKGLNPGDKFTLKLGAIRTLDGNSTTQEASREGNYTVNGITKIFNSDDANNRELSFTNVTVSAEGEISLTVSVTDHTANVPDFAYLGWMKLIPAAGSSKVINSEKLSGTKSLINSAVNGSIGITYITAGDSKRDDTTDYPAIYTGILSDLKVAYIHDSLTGVTAEAWTNQSDSTKPGLAKAIKDAKGIEGANTIIEYSLGANDWNLLPGNDQNKYATIKPLIKKGITELQRLLPSAKVVLINPIGTHRPELKKAYRDIAKELALPMLENPMDQYRDNPAKKDIYFQDNIHPNLKGAKLLVKTILQTVTEGQARTIVDSK